MLKSFFPFDLIVVKKWNDEQVLDNYNNNNKVRTTVRIVFIYE